MFAQTFRYKARTIEVRGLAFLLLIAMLVTACSSSTRTTPPAYEDRFWPYAGLDTSFSVVCDEIDHLFAYDPDAPLNIQEESSKHTFGLTVTDLTYASPKGGRVPATLVIPAGKGPFAGMLMQHGMGAGMHPGARKSNLQEAQLFARLGAAVLLIDAPYNRPEHGIYSSLSFTDKDRDEQIQYIVDLRRGVDLLLSIPEVDPHRLAYVGFSGGGAIGGLLAGVEHRLQGYVLVVGDGGIVTHLTGPEDFGWWSYKPAALREEFIARMWPIEPVHYIGCTAPAALLYQNGTRDASVPVEDAYRYQKAGSQPKTVLWYRANHDEMVSDTFALLDRAEWLKDLIRISSLQNFQRNVDIVLLGCWLVLFITCLAWVIWDLWRRHRASAGTCLQWMLTILLNGPLGALVYWIATRRREAGEAEAPAYPARYALGSAAWAASGNMLGIVLLLIFATRTNISPILICALILAVPACTGWLIYNLSRLLSHADASYRAAYRFPGMASLTSTCLVLLGAVPTFLFLLNQAGSSWIVLLLTGMTYYLLWGVTVAATAAGMLITYPFHLWMIRRGVIRWDGAGYPEQPLPAGVPWVQQVAALFLALASIITMLTILLNL